MSSQQTNDFDMSSRKFESGNFIFVGMMGSGKTTVARLLAKRLGKKFIDSDEEIQRCTGVTIPHIFDVEGESGFRQRETAVIQGLVAGDNMVLATGGGAVLAEQNRKLLQQNGVVIYLDTNVHDLWQRTRHDKNRPLLQVDDLRAKLTALLEQRDPLYREVSDIVMKSGKRSVQSFIRNLVFELARYREQ